MTFMDSLAANPTGSISGFDPNAGRMSGGDALELVNKLKDREMMDFKDKANFMSDLSVRQQQRMKNLFDPFDTQTPGFGVNATGGGAQNTVIAHDPNQMTGYEKGELGIRQQQVDLEGQKLGQQKKFGQEALDIKEKQEKLNEEKNKNIHEQKLADMQRKIEDANNKLGLAYDQLNNKQTTSEEQIRLHRQIQDAMEERHKLELAHKDLIFEEAKRLHDAQIEKMKKDADARGRSTTTTEINPEGTKRTVTTTRGTQSSNKGDTFTGIGRDGKEYQVPWDQLEDWNANHAKPGTEVKQPEGDNE